MLDVCHLIPESLEGMNLETVSRSVNLETVSRSANLETVSRSVNLESVSRPANLQLESHYNIITMLSCLGTIQLYSENSRQ